MLKRVLILLTIIAVGLLVYTVFVENIFSPRRKSFSGRWFIERNIAEEKGALFSLIEGREKTGPELISRTELQRDIHVGLCMQPQYATYV